MSHGTIFLLTSLGCVRYILRVMDATDKKPLSTTITPQGMIRLALSEEQKDRLAKMAATDRRKHADFIRILIDDEWNRRQKATEGNGAAA
jgi:hypothetical protein